VSAEGVSFTEQKRGKVLDFPLPRTQKELQAFLGLINYFRDHVPDMTALERPLRALMNHSKKNCTLLWNTNAETSFQNARDTIASCPALYFVDERATIIVMTDASDFGVGSYIFQVIDGKEKPIIFFSKALHGAELNWSTIEKEAYAIFLTLTKFSHLLRDNKFLLKTDHKNLTYIDAGSSQKVRRWGIALQEFDFDIEHVPGKDNFVADSFSRLCVNNQPVKNAPEQTLAVLEHEIFPHKLTDEVHLRISRAHNAEVGHFGVDKTITHLVASGTKWKRMRQHVRQFVHLCPICQKLRERHLSLKTHPFTTAAYLPMDVLNIDSIGPMDADDDGNKYILVIVDCFTRWVELFPIPDTSAKVAAEVLLQHVGRYGAPSTIRSDKGSQFVNGIIAEFLQLVHTEHAQTIAYSKEENAIVERANKEVMRHLRAIIFHRKSQNKWSRHHLPLVMRILNSEEKKNTGLSPAEILFGNTVDLGRRILHASPPTSNDPKEPLSDYMDKMLAAQADLIKVAQETQLKHDTHHMSTFEKNFSEFPINSYVLLDPPEGNRPKLQTRKKGPFQVINIVGSKYVLQDLLSGKNFETHVSNLSPFNHDETRTDPTDVAMHDEQEFLIDAILAHRGDRTRRSTMEFKVRWLGFGDTYDSWEPYTNLRDTSCLTEYLAANKLKSLLPK
jgi:transposase InsO family protein